jgi:hypothetical protein
MSTLRLTTISNQGGTSTVPSETVINGSAKAWVNFNGTGTIAIRASFNVSSITDNGTGNYFINFASALTDANYSITGIGGHVVGVVTTFSSVREGTRTTSGVQVDYFTVSSTYYDTNDANVAIFR